MRTSYLVFATDSRRAFLIQAFAHTPAEAENVVACTLMDDLGVPFDDVLATVVDIGALPTVHVEVSTFSDLIP